MEKIESRLRINALLSVYGEELAPNEKEDLINYYENDLSIGEIAANRQVSRNAVYSSLKEGKRELEKMESNLHFLQIDSDIIDKIDSLVNEKDIEKIKEELMKIKEKINHGI